MRGLAMLVIVGGCVAISGCNSKAELSDVEPIIRDFWAPCPFVSVENLRKLNGLKREQSYLLSVAYELRVQFDVAAEDNELGKASAFSENCKGQEQRLAVARLYYAQVEPYQGYKKDKVLKISVEYVMVNSENGWVVSSAH